MAKRVLLVMKRKLLSDSLMEHAAIDSRFELMSARDYSTAVLTAKMCLPEIAVVEIPESGAWRFAEKCFVICDSIKRQFPCCKLVILCNENDRDSYNAAIQAKQESRIDDFLFYDSSIHYFFSKLESL